MRGHAALRPPPELEHQIWRGPEVATSSESGSSRSLGFNADRPQLLHVVYRDDASDSQGPDSVHSSGQASQRHKDVIVKNSFLEVVDAESTSLRAGARVRSRSVSEMSSSTSRSSEHQAKKVETIYLGNLREPLVTSALPTVARPQEPPMPALAALAPAAVDPAPWVSSALHAADAPEEQLRTWSEGSRLHDSGNCRPCLHVNTKVGCLNGANCNFCHYNHLPRSRTRLCKAKRQQCVKQAMRLYESYDGDVARLLADNPLIARESADQTAENSYILSIIRSKQRHDSGQGQAGQGMGVEGRPFPF